MLRASRRPALLAAAAALAAAAGPAAADGWSLRIEPGWTLSESVITDETGRKVETESDLFLQKYRLALDKSILPLLFFSAGGFLDWVQGTQRIGAVSGDFDAKRWNGYLSLKAGGPFLNAALDYNRREELAEVRTGGTLARAPHLVRDSYSAALTWRPSELPSVDLRVGRIDTYDVGRDVYDQTASDASVALRYSPVREVDLRYSVLYAESTDRKTEVDAASLTNGLFASWGDTFLDGRAAAYLNYNATARSSRFVARGPGGYLDRLQIPTGGLSKVEGPLDTTERIALNANAALVDGNTLASAGLNLGYSASAAGDTARRDLGGTFPNVITPVNRILVYLDRQLADNAGVLAQFVTGLSAFTAWRSDDNLDWTPVDLHPTEPVRYEPLLNRFEIPLAAEVEARHLKVVTRPLATGVTTDPQYAEIFVTEIQFVLRTQAADVPSSDFIFSHNLNGSTRLVLLKDPSLSYDLSFTLTDDSRTDRVTYAVVNGLSLSKRLSRALVLAARVDRSDADAGRGHEALNRWSASLSADPLPTLGGTLNYSGQLSQMPEGDTLSHSAGAYARADLYQGVSFSAGGTLSLSETPDGIANRTATASGTASFIPNRSLSLSGSVAYTETARSGGGRPSEVEDSGVVEGTASLSPFPALALSASFSRYFAVALPSTIATFTGTLSPFPGGDLQFRYGYQETLDTGGETRSRTHGPGIRWNIRQGWYADATASFSTSRSPAQTVDARDVFVSLLATL